MNYSPMLSQSGNSLWWPVLAFRHVGWLLIPKLRSAVRIS
jgi:hypothetical protein